MDELKVSQGVLGWLSVKYDLNENNAKLSTPLHWPAKSRLKKQLYIAYLISKY